eukprot:24742-Amphidinium_carterae.2
MAPPCYRRCRPPLCCLHFLRQSCRHCSQLLVGVLPFLHLQTVLHTLLPVVHDMGVGMEWTAKSPDGECSCHQFEPQGSTRINRTEFEKWR